MGENRVYSQTITATELKKNLGKYLDYVSDDNEVVITKNGEKTVRMTPYLSDFARCEQMQLREQALDYGSDGKKVSYDEFMEIYEHSELRMELIEGEILLQTSPSLRHQEISGRLYLIFSQYLRGKSCKAVYAPFDVHFFKPEFKDPDVCQPDLLIACDLKETLNEKGQYMGTPALVAEILSPGTRSRDMVKKLKTYMLSGVQEYWLVDPDQNILLQYVFMNREVASFQSYKDTGSIASKTFEGLSASLEEVFEA